MNTVKYMGHNIPVKMDLSDSLQKQITENKETIIKLFKQDIINAFTCKRNECKRLLINNIYTAKFYSPNIITYSYNDDHTEIFNIHSYDLMGEAIELIQNNNWKRFLSDTDYLEQLINAVFLDWLCITSKKFKDIVITPNIFLSIVIEFFKQSIKK